MRLPGITTGKISVLVKIVQSARHDFGYQPVSIIAFQFGHYSAMPKKTLNSLRSIGPCSGLYCNRFRIAHLVLNDKDPHIHQCPELTPFMGIMITVAARTTKAYTSDDAPTLHGQHAFRKKILRLGTFFMLFWAGSGYCLD